MKYTACTLDNANTLLVNLDKYINYGLEVHNNRNGDNMEQIKETLEFDDVSIIFAVANEDEPSIRMTIEQNNNTVGIFGFYNTRGISSIDNTGICVSDDFETEGSVLFFNNNMLPYPCGGDQFFQFDLINEVGNKEAIDSIVQILLNCMKQHGFKSTYILFTEALGVQGAPISIIEAITQ